MKYTLPKKPTAAPSSDYDDYARCVSFPVSEELLEAAGGIGDKIQVLLDGTLKRKDSHAGEGGEEYILEILLTDVELKKAKTIFEDLVEDEE